MLAQGKQVSGKFPSCGAASQEIRYRKNGNSFTSYIVYDSNGRAIKRVDLTGRPHAGINPPHVIEYIHNPCPDGTVGVGEERRSTRDARLRKYPKGVLMKKVSLQTNNLADFQQWKVINDEDFSLIDYLYFNTSFDLAIAFTKLFWPDFIEHQTRFF